MSLFSRFLSSIFVLSALVSAPARADEALFGYIYTTDSLPAKQWEFEQIQTLRTGKARGQYTSLDLRTEVEYGISDRFSTAFYVNTSWLRQINVYDPEDYSKNLPDVNKWAFNGVSMEFKYRLLSPYIDPVGLSLYLEPEFEVRDAQTGGKVSAKALEFRLIFHKTYLDDTLTLASNIMFEPEWETADGVAMKELWSEFTFGISYRFIPNWWIGLEFRNHREFPDFDFGQQEHSAFFLGPAIHYGVKDYWATLTLLPQIAGNPGELGIGADRRRIDGGSLHLGQHEKFEARLKIGVNL